MPLRRGPHRVDRKSTRLNSSHGSISYAVFCLKKKRTRCGVRESSTESRCAWPAAAAETRGTAGAAVGAPVRNGLHAADALAWSLHFLFADAPTCELYPLPLHDALPI